MLFKAKTMSKKVNGKLTQVKPFIGLAVGFKISQLIVGLLKHEPNASGQEDILIKATVPGNDLGTAIRSVNALSEIYQIHGYLVQIMPQYWDHSSSVIMKNEYQQTLREFAHKEEIDTHVARILSDKKIQSPSVIDQIYLTMIEYGCRPSIKGLIKDLEKDFLPSTPLIKGLTKNISPSEQRNGFDDAGLLLEDLGFSSCIWGSKVEDVRSYNNLWWMIDSKNISCIIPSLKKGDLQVSRVLVSNYNESRMTTPLDLAPQVPSTYSLKLKSKIIFTEISLNGNIQMITGSIETPTGEYELKFPVRVWRALCGLNYQELLLEAI